MKKMILGFLATAALGFLPLAASAADGSTVVGGQVTNNGSSVDGAKVTVVCNGHQKKTTTDASGVYAVQFKIANCPAGSSVSVDATKKKEGAGHSTGTANPLDTQLNVAIVNVALPELGLLTGMGALIAGGGALFAIRRRNLDVRTP